MTTQMKTEQLKMDFQLTKQLWSNKREDEKQI